MPSLVELRPGDGPTLAFVHSSIGDTACYAPLAARLPAGPRIVAIAPDGLAAGGPPPVDDLRTMAAGYAALLTAAGVRGPLRVAGWAMGGVVAAELGEQLLEGGHPVELIAVFDGRVPQPEMRTRPIDPDTVGVALANHIARVAGRDLAAPPASGAPADVHAALLAAGVLPAGWDVAEVARRRDLFVANSRALFRHVPRPLRPPVLLCESSDEHPAHPRPPTLGWEPFAAVTRVRVPGNHFTLLAASSIGPLADAVAAALVRADAVR